MSPRHQICSSLTQSYTFVIFLREKKATFYIIGKDKMGYEREISFWFLEVFLPSKVAEQSQALFGFFQLDFV